MTTALVPGVPTSLVQNAIYALPAYRVLFFCDEAITLKQSNTVELSHTITITLANGQAELAGGFVQNTSTAAIATIKRI